MSEEKLELIHLFENVLNNANHEEQHVLRDVLKGIERKQKGETRTYINGVLNYQGNRTGEKSYRAEIDLQPFANNPLQILHGGITATFADTAMGTLVNHVLDDAHTSVTSEIKVNYLKPAIGKKLICEANVIHQGKNICFISASVLSDEGKTVAFASGSFFIIPVPEGMIKRMDAKD